MGVQHLTDQVQPKPATVPVPTLPAKWLENPLMRFSGDAWALVGHIDAAVAAHAQVDHPGRAAMRHRVAEQIRQRPADRVRVALKIRWGWAELKLSS